MLDADRIAAAEEIDTKILCLRQSPFNHSAGMENGKVAGWGSGPRWI